MLRNFHPPCATEQEHRGARPPTNHMLSRPTCDFSQMLIPSYEPQWEEAPSLRHDGSGCPPSLWGHIQNPAHSECPTLSDIAGHTQGTLHAASGTASVVDSWDCAPVSPRSSLPTPRSAAAAVAAASGVPPPMLPAVSDAFDDASGAGRLSWLPPSQWKLRRTASSGDLQVLQGLMARAEQTDGESLFSAPSWSDFSGSDASPND